MMTRLIVSAAFRAFNPWPMSRFEAAENSIKVWQSRVAEQTPDKPAGTILQADKTEGIYVATGQGVLVLEQLQVPGKKAMSVQDILNSCKLVWSWNSNFLNRFKKKLPSRSLESAPRGAEMPSCI